MRAALFWLFKTVCGTIIGSTCLLTLHFLDIYPDRSLAKMAASMIEAPPVVALLWIQIALSVIVGSAAIAVYELVARRYFRLQLAPSPPTLALKIPSKQDHREVDLQSISDRALKTHAIELAKRIREFDANADIQRPEMPMIFVVSLDTPEEKAASDQARLAAHNKYIFQDKEFQARKTTEFNNSYLPHVRGIKSELETRLKKKGRFPPYIDNQHLVIAGSMIDHGHFAGSKPYTNVADYIDGLARALAPQPEEESSFNTRRAEQEQVTEDNNIYQAGVAVGVVFGGRRKPDDATRFTFVEITRSGSFNFGEPFEFQGLAMRVETAASRVGMSSDRPQDGVIYSGVVARINGKETVR